VSVVVIGQWCFLVPGGGSGGGGGALGPCWQGGTEGPWGCSLGLARLVQW
jgi:hypothetical protein